MAARLLRCTLPAASWGIKRRRTKGRRPSPPPSVFVSQDEEDCILGLLMLSDALLDLRRGVPPPQAPKQLLFLPPRSPTPPPAEAQEQESPHLISFPGLMPLLPPPEKKQPLLSSTALKQQRRQQNERLSPATPSTADLRRYECSECGRAFSSYQALGGHKSIHRKRRAANDRTEKQRRLVMARRAMAMSSASLTECSPKKGLSTDLNQPAIGMD
ncbi:zinc finger protein ZAT9-like [Zingiber officinale]|uniref:zinc finger protein ZAT9-like n=1 Tax=Zingiber officinale TaxID=94328 RepID=UPI001C4AB0C9|nr:zinc finger protein ZAT9-like [Zingiber officinale]